jgi:hypothetical protein
MWLHLRVFKTSDEIYVFIFVDSLYKWTSVRNFVIIQIFQLFISPYVSGTVFIE